MKKLFLLVLLLLSGLSLYGLNTKPVPSPVSPLAVIEPPQTESAPISTPSPALPTLPPTKILPQGAQVFQSFNNCGPASLSMALSHFGISVSQQELSQVLRPYQHATGNNDDKSVSLEEMATLAQSYSLAAYYRPNGNLEILKKFVAAGYPVIVRTLLTLDDDIGHYRVITGYDEQAQEIIQDDSLQGANLRFSYAEFSKLWQRQNYEYLALVPKSKEALAQTILGDNADSQTAWENFLVSSRQAIAKNPDDIYNRFNLSIALYHTGNFQESVNEYEQIQNQLPFRTLWYQIEPIQAYYQLGDYQKVFTLTDAILQGGNRAFSQLYLIRGNIYKKQGNLTAAKHEYEQAVLYHKNMPEAQKLLKSVL